MALDPVHVQWLSMVRYQTDLAVEQSHQPVPLAMIAAAPTWPSTVGCRASASREE